MLPFELVLIVLREFMLPIFAFVLPMLGGDMFVAFTGMAGLAFVSEFVV